MFVQLRHPLVGSGCRGGGGDLGAIEDGTFAVVVYLAVQPAGHVSHLRRVERRVGETRVAEVDAPTSIQWRQTTPAPPAKQHQVPSQLVPSSLRRRLKQAGHQTRRSGATPRPQARRHGRSAAGVTTCEILEPSPSGIRPTAHKPWDVYLHVLNVNARVIDVWAGVVVTPPTHSPTLPPERRL